MAERHENIRMRETLQGNEYKGAAADLIAAGVLQEQEIPARSRATFKPDGTRVRQGENFACKLQGYKTVERRGGKFTVTIRQSEEEQKRRSAEFRAERDAEWVAKREAQAGRAREVTRTLPARSHLRLVWSAPA